MLIRKKYVRCTTKKKQLETMFQTSDISYVVKFFRYSMTEEQKMKEHSR